MFEQKYQSIVAQFKLTSAWTGHWFILLPKLQCKLSFLISFAIAANQLSRLCFSFWATATQRWFAWSHLSSSDDQKSVQTEHLTSKNVVVQVSESICSLRIFSIKNFEILEQQSFLLVVHISCISSFQTTFLQLFCSCHCPVPPLATQPFHECVSPSNGS